MRGLLCARRDKLNLEVERMIYLRRRRSHDDERLQNGLCQLLSSAKQKCNVFASLKLFLSFFPTCSSLAPDIGCAPWTTQQADLSPI